MSYINEFFTSQFREPIREELVKLLDKIEEFVNTDLLEANNTMFYVRYEYSKNQPVKKFLRACYAHYYHEIDSWDSWVFQLPIQIEGDTVVALGNWALDKNPPQEITYPYQVREGWAKERRREQARKRSTYSVEGIFYPVRDYTK